MPKNYYIILGIPANSSHSDIKSAYRRLAKEYHPDYYPKSNSPFQAIQEAYSVLSDPLQRKQYDDSLDALRERRKEYQRADMARNELQECMEPVVSEQTRVEPLIPDVEGNSRGLRSGFDSLLNQFFNIPPLVWDDRGNRVYENMEIYLTPEQAQRGGQIRVYLPARIICPSCQGRSGGRPWECRQCVGLGYIAGEVPLLLDYPQGIADNHIVEFHLSRYGFSRSSLMVRFKVDEHP
jgi:molecular chaperone DnaJ